jgi:hypothetical protein
VILHIVHILTVLIQINILLCCTFIVRGEESTSCIFVVVVDFKGKERRCLSKLKWAEKNVKEQNLLSYFKTASQE